MARSQLKVAVVGAGVAGLAIAWRLAQGGASVTLFESGPIPSRNGAASWASAGMLCARLEMASAPQALAAFALNARAAWPAFAAEIERASGMPCGFAERGALVALYDGPLASHHAGIQQLDAVAARHIEPGLSPDITGALWAPEEAEADPRWLLLALAKAARTAGVVLAERTPVRRLVEQDWRVSGLLLSDGQRQFDHIVLAAGAWTGGLLQVSSLPGPRVRPVKGQMLALDGDASRPPLRRIVWTEGAYIVPHADGRIVIGATQEDVGFDSATDDAALDELRAAATRAVPGLAELNELERFHGFRPAADDGLPVIGSIGPAGLTLASGQFRNGILLAPLIADAAVSHVLTGRLPGNAHPFAAGRFAEAAA